MARKSKSIESYYPEFIHAILPKIEKYYENKILCLTGFGENLKWLSRILSENNLPFEIFDWRKRYINFDCCFKHVQEIHGILNLKSPIIVLCCDQYNELAEAIKMLVNSDLNEIPVIYHFDKIYTPFQHLPTVSSIAKRAKKRAITVNSDDRLFNLVQLVHESLHIKGSIVEFGTFTGGTGAYIVETLVRNRSDKKVYLCDSFEGLPPSKLGIDYMWTGAFLNNSYEEVKQKFSDVSNVSILKGNIVENLDKINFPISFAHVDVDTYYGTQKITEHIWPLISRNGIILFDDYGFFPNCIPLTIFVNEFAENIDCFKFYLPSNGYFLIKNQS